MTLVRIVKSWHSPNLLRQTPGGTGVWGDCTFTLDPVERCDYLIAFNHIPHEMTVEVPRANIWCVVQEPPIPVYRWVENGFPLYHRVLTQDLRLRGRKIMQTHGSLPWHVTRSYDELRAAPPPPKTRDLSWITSNLAAQAGHRRRLAFLERLKASAVTFDLYGRGFAPVADKWDGLAPYRYSIAVEKSFGAELLDGKNRGLLPRRHDADLFRRGEYRRLFPEGFVRVARDRRSGCSATRGGNHPLRSRGA